MQTSRLPKSTLVIAGMFTVSAQALRTKNSSQRGHWHRETYKCKTCAENVTEAKKKRGAQKLVKNLPMYWALAAALKRSCLSSCRTHHCPLVEAACYSWSPRALYFLFISTSMQFFITALSESFSPHSTQGHFLLTQKSPQVFSHIFIQILNISISTRGLLQRDTFPKHTNHWETADTETQAELIQHSDGYQASEIIPSLRVQATLESSSTGLGTWQDFTETTSGLLGWWAIIPAASRLESKKTKSSCVAHGKKTLSWGHDNAASLAGLLHVKQQLGCLTSSAWQGDFQNVLINLPKLLWCESRFRD